MGKPFRLTAPPILESALQRQIVDYLRHEQARGRIGPFCRVNGGLARIKRAVVRFYRLFLSGKDECSTGHPDLYGIYGPQSAHPGRYFALEVKRPGQYATDAQIAFLDAVRVSGGVAATVWSFRDVKSVLFGEIDVWEIENERENHEETH